jgi:hypothetical protein
LTPGVTISGTTGTWITRFFQSGNSDSILGQAAGAGHGVFATSNTGRAMEAQGGPWGLISFASSTGRGVEGQGGIGGIFFGNNDRGVEGHGNGLGGIFFGGNRGVEGQTTNPNDWAGIFFGQGTGNNNALAAVGRFTVFGGPKSAAVPLQSGQYVALYAVESTENWFEDVGGDQLTNGTAIVSLDEVFSQTVNTAMPYRVFLTPNGACNLYVAEKGPDSFRVELLSGATDCSFDYRVVAKRLGFENERLLPLDLPRPGSASSQSARQ